MSLTITLGQAIFISVKPILKIYLIIFTGWLLVKFDILSMETSRGISSMVVNVILPCLTFNKIITNLSGSQIKEIGITVLTSLILTSFGGLLAFIAGYLTPVPKKWKYGLLFSGMFGNISDFPIAYIQSMGTGLVFTSDETDKGAAISCIFLATQQFLLMNIGLFQLVGLDFREKNDIEINSTTSPLRVERLEQNTQSIINEYSEANALKTVTDMEELAKTISRTQEIGLNINHSSYDKFSKWDLFVKRYRLGWLEYILVNLIRVPSFTIIIAITIAMIPWVRCLFVKNSIKIREAPDELPVLNFLMDFSSYVGSASVPMSLLLLGGTIARLEITKIPKGYWKTLIFMIPMRLTITPIFGILWTNKLYTLGWITEDISRFILMITWAVPSATSQVFYTAFYTPLEGDHVQMDCLAIFLLVQYPILIFTMPIEVSYVLKVSLGL